MAQTKLKLGKKTDKGYEYSTKINFKEDFTSQINKLMKEKKAHDELESQLRKLEKAIQDLTAYKKDKDLLYYYIIGKNLLFLDKENFRNIKPYSIYRRITEEIPEILPNIKDKKTIQKHLEIMFRIAHIEKNHLSKASWDQWYEILKFKDIYKDKKLLRLILNECKKGISGISLRNKIKELRNDHKINKYNIIVK